MNGLCQFDGDLRNELWRRSVDRDLNDLVDLDLVDLDLVDLFWNNRDLNELWRRRFWHRFDLDLLERLWLTVPSVAYNLLNGVTSDLIAVFDGVPNDLGAVVENFSKECSSVDNGVEDDQFNEGVKDVQSY